MQLGTSWGEQGSMGLRREGGRAGGARARTAASTRCRGESCNWGGEGQDRHRQVLLLSKVDKPLTHQPQFGARVIPVTAPTPSAPPSPSDQGGRP